MKIPTTPVILASLSFASSSLAAPTSKKPDCESPRIGEHSPLLGRDVWEPALHLKGVSGQGRPWGGQRKREETSLGNQSPQMGGSPSFGTASTPLLGDTSVNAAANPDPVLGAASGLLAPVTGVVGSATGTLKGVLGTTTGTLNGLLGATPLGPVVGTVGGIGNGLLDKVGTIGNGGLGLGTILKPIGDTLNGLPLVGPIVGPIAGGLASTVGGLSLAQQIAPTPNVTPQINQYGQFVGNAMPTVQEVQETIVGRLADGRLVTNTGRLLGLANAGGVGDVPVSGLPFQPPTGLDSAGQILRPITSNPGVQGPLSGLPGLGDLGGVVGGAVPQLGNTGGGALPQLGNIGGSVPQLGNVGGAVPQFGNIGGGVPQLGNIGGALPSTDLGKIVTNLPPGLGQILQPVGSAEKYLQIGNQLIPLGNLDPGQLAQLGLDRLPVTPVNAGFGYPAINYLQDGETPEHPDSDPQSKEVQANPVTSWMDAGNSTATDGGMFPAPDNSTMPDESTRPDGSATPLTTKSQMPMTEQLQVQPLELAPPSMANNQTVAGKPHSIIKGENEPWYDVKIDGGDTFQRIAAEMSGQEKNYYGGGSRDPDNTDGPAMVMDPKSEGRKGWHKISSSAYSSHSTQASATGTMLSSSTFAAPTPAPTPSPEEDAGTYAWSEDWGDWVSADYDDDSGLRVGWDETSTFPASASATTSVPNPTSSTMSGNTSAGLS